MIRSAPSGTPLPHPLTVFKGLLTEQFEVPQEPPQQNEHQDGGQAPTTHLLCAVPGGETSKELAHGASRSWGVARSAKGSANRVHSRPSTAQRDGNSLDAAEPSVKSEEIP